MLSVEKIQSNIELISNSVNSYIGENYPNRKMYKVNIENILNTLMYCVKDNSLSPIENLSRMYFTQGQLNLKYLHIEYESYRILLETLGKLLSSEEDQAAMQICSSAIEKLKKILNSGIATNNDQIFTVEHETRVKNMLYSWDDEKNIMLGMQQCQRNWDLSKTLRQDVVDYLLWIGQNAPTKQHEAYYDIYWSTDRETLDYLYKFTWGSTHRKNPPAMWRNSQMNANLYMIFVCKQPETMYNCNNDGTLQDPFGASRMQNSIVSVGMAMGLVMRAAHRMGLKTGPNKIVDLGPDYNYEWEKRLGIFDDMKAGTKKLYYGLGIGFPNKDRPRWESDDTEFAIGASNGHNVTTRFNDPDYNPISPNGQEKRKIKIVDIKKYGGQVLIDPYGKPQEIPTEHSIKINTVYKRDIKLIEIPKKT